MSVECVLSVGYVVCVVLSVRCVWDVRIGAGLLADRGQIVCAYFVVSC